METASACVRCCGGLAAVVAATLFAGAPAHALDISRPIALPARVTDGVLQVGPRRLRLPSGDWVLTGQSFEETVGGRGGAERHGEGVHAWAALMRGGELRALVWLGLPLEDFPHVHHRRRNTCTDDDSIERLDLSKTLTQPECLGVYGHRDLQAPLGARSPRTLEWLRERHAADPGPVVRFVYKIRTDNSYGGVSMIMPTAPFAADEEASRWARGLRDACRPLFEGRIQEARLPEVPEPPAGASAASAVVPSNP
jgi:hypothetical protein